MLAEHRVLFNLWRTPQFVREFQLWHVNLFVKTHLKSERSCRGGGGQEEIDTEKER